MNPGDAERRGMHSHAERGNDQAVRCHTERFVSLTLASSRLKPVPLKAMRAVSATDSCRKPDAFPRGAWERSGNQVPHRKICIAHPGLFPAEAGPTKSNVSSRWHRRRPSRTGFSREALDLDLQTREVQTTPIATWVQAERRSRAVGRAAWMRRERRQDMDVRSARAHGARPE
jgi:hypothetical protein